VACMAWLRWAQRATVLVWRVRLHATQSGGGDGVVRGAAALAGAAGGGVHSGEQHSGTG
jgi:hypothetical protein